MRLVGRVLRVEVVLIYVNISGRGTGAERLNYFKDRPPNGSPVGREILPSITRKSYIRHASSAGVKYAGRGGGINRAT
jgi:hypothetical protein